MQIPLFVRQFLFDALVGAVMGIVLLNLPLAGSVDEAVGQGLLIASVVLKALFGAAGRAVPSLLGYASEKLGLGEADLEPTDYAPIGNILVDGVDTETPAEHPGSLYHL